MQFKYFYNTKKKFQARWLMHSIQWFNIVSCQCVCILFLVFFAKFNKSDDNSYNGDDM